MICCFTMYVWHTERELIKERQKERIKEGRKGGGERGKKREIREKEGKEDKKRDDEKERGYEWQTLAHTCPTIVTHTGASDASV